LGSMSAPWEQVAATHFRQRLVIAAIEGGAYVKSLQRKTAHPWQSLAQLL